MSDEQERVEQLQASELEREERRLERLRLIVGGWPAPAARFEDFEPDPQEAA